MQRLVAGLLLHAGQVSLREELACGDESGDQRGSDREAHVGKERVVTLDEDQYREAHARADIWRPRRSLQTPGGDVAGRQRPA